jgi:formylglycine-generating enzyme required for sulfatase activity
MGGARIVASWAAIAACGTNHTPSTSCSGSATPCEGNTLVSGGAFYRGYDVGADGMFQDMSHPATVSDFRLDTYEVTVARFRAFVDAGMGTQQNPPPAGAGARTLNGAAAQGGWDQSWNTHLASDTAALVNAVKCDSFWQAWTDAPGANESLPMNCISWNEAFAFCAWDGGFLPTETEWHYAAAGGSEQRAYPWSSPAGSLTIDCSYANYAPTDTTPCVRPPKGSVEHVGSESPKGDGKWGQADLGGNVAEWTLDFYATPYRIDSCDDCADLTPSPAPPSYRVVCGGQYDSIAVGARGMSRTNASSEPPFRTFEIGVRCARAP